MIVKGWLQHVYGTTVHKGWVARNLAIFCVDDALAACSPAENLPFRPRLYFDLMARAFVHDFSKYSPDEALAFARTSGELKVTEYGTDEYRALLRQIKPAIDLHYRRNSHHPEHHHEGLAGMAEEDVIEMVADWGAAIRRGPNGDLDLSIVKNAERFDYDRETEKQLRRIARRMRLL